MEDFFTLQYQDKYTIRSFNSDEMLYVSLTDIIRTLAQENREIHGDKPAPSSASILKAQLQVLDSDEHKNFPVLDHNGQLVNEIFVTEPGLYRVLSRNETEAGRNFQRWMFHEVLTSIRKHGTYPPPEQFDDPHEATAQLLVQHSQRLLLEIQERKKLAAETKKLAQETKKRFDRNEQMLQELSDQMSEQSEGKVGLVSIADFMTNQGVYEYDEQFFAAMCFKISIENNLPTSKGIDKNNFKEHRFRLEVMQQIFDDEFATN